MTPKHALYSGLIFVTMACGGGGASCGGCACMEPLEGGFPVDQMAVGAGQVRITGAALDVIEANINPILGSFMSMECPGGEVPCPGGSSCANNVCTANGRPVSTIGFRVPQTSVTGLRVCQGAGRNECNVYVDIRGMQLDPSDPDRVNVTARMDISSHPIKLESGPRWATIRCDLRITARNKAIAVPLTLRADNPLRRFAIGVGDPQFEITSDDLRLCGGLNWARGAILALVRGQINDAIRDAVHDAVDENLYQTCDNGCPTDTQCGDGYCRFPGGAKVPIAMGLEGRLNLGEAMAGMGPPGMLSGVVDIGMVAGGAAGARGGGIEVGIMGGARVEEPSACVPTIEQEVPQISPVQFNDAVPRGCEGGEGDCSDGYSCDDGYCTNGEGATEPAPFHVGFGLAQQYMEQMLLGFHQGGALCLKVGSELSEMISSGTMGLLMPSLNTLIDGHQPNPAPMRLSIVPRSLPRLEVGQGRYELQEGERVLVEPLLHVKVDDMAIAFELMIQERYVRVATVLVDLAIGLGMTVDGDNNLVLTMSDPTDWVQGVEVTDAKILVETEEEIAEAIPALLDLAMPMLMGNLDSSFALPELGVFALGVEGIRGQRPRPQLGEDGHERYDYMAIFASLSVNGGNPDRMEVGTRAHLVGVEAGQTEAYRVSNPGALFRPRVIVDLELNGAGQSDFELSYRIDGGLWRHFQPVQDGQRMSITGSALSIQGPHRIELVGRVAGQPYTVDATPAVIETVIDTEAPELRLLRQDGALVAYATDRVWRPEDIQIRLLADGELVDEGVERLDIDLPEEAESVLIEAEDGAGQIVRLPLRIGSLPSPALAQLSDPVSAELAEGCSCDAVGFGSALWLLPILALRRRRRRVA